MTLELFGLYFKMWPMIRGIVEKFYFLVDSGKGKKNV